MIALAGLLLVINLVCPRILNDENDFLINFVNHELIATLGFMTTLSFGIATSLHIELNKLEDAIGNDFEDTRKSISLSIESLFVLLILSFILVIIKSSLKESHQITAQIINSISIFIVIIFIWILYDLILTAFGIPTIKKAKEAQEKEKK